MIDKINEFLDKKTTLPKIIIIYGPTASGKTSLSLDVAKYLNSEIIGADSRQIYRLLDIGSGKITEEQKQGITHHMIDIIDINEKYSVGEYKKESRIIIDNLINKGVIPIICGGTGLYLDTIAFNYNIPEIEPDWDLRGELEETRLEKGNQYLWNLLNEIDSDYAKTLDINNYRYIIRGIEVMRKTGKSKLELKSKNNPIYDILFLTPFIESREKLYNKINGRIEEMFNEGLIEEVEKILKLYSKDSFGLNTIGYKEVIEYLEGNITLEKCMELVKQHNRNYAKRQFTWFKKYNLDYFYQ